MLDLKELEEKLLEALDKETEESLTAWLSQKHSEYSDILLNLDTENYGIVSDSFNSLYFEEKNFSEPTKNCMFGGEYLKAA